LPSAVPGPLPFQRGDFQDDASWLISPRVRFTPNEQLSLTAFYAYTDSRLESLTTFPTMFGPVASNNRSATSNQEISLQGDYTVWEDRLTVSAGYSYNDTTYQRRNRQTGATLFKEAWTSQSPWLQLQWTPLEALRLTGGVRYNAFNRFRNETTYDAQVAYRVAATGTRLFAKVATGYTIPTPNDVGSGTLNNQTLKPEESFSWEIGFKQPLLDEDRLAIEAVYFHNRLDNLVGFDPLTFRAFNVNEATTEGIEVGAHYRPDPRVKLFGNFTWLDARSRSNQAFGPQDGQRLLRRPEYTYTVGIEGNPLEKVVAGFSITGVANRVDFGQVPMKDYVYGRLYASWQFWDHAEIFGRIENLFNQAYDGAAQGFPALPRNAYVGMRFGF